MNDEAADRGREPLIEDRLGTRARVYGAERAILVGLDTGFTRSADGQLFLELESLSDTAGIQTLAEVVQRRRRPDAATFIGKGKVSEVRTAAAELDADVVIFNDELTPAQARNLEESLGRKVVDRTQLIMDIFAQRAATKEAKLQVEMAQLRYLLPRLRGWGMALTRTGGGIGTRGPGETQLEMDRHKVNRRIHVLECRLAQAKAERSLRRRKRSRSRLPQVALVGYTNSGKSTLLNQLCGTDCLVEDKLFATLDTVVRRGPVGRGREALFIDTVGFIRDLPHDLVPAFAATLEAARFADLIVHVIDVARPSWEQDARSVLETLEKEVFGSGDARPPIFSVLNKLDQVVGEVPEVSNGVAISAAQGAGIDRLLEGTAAMLYSDERERELFVPFAALDALYTVASAERIHVLEHTRRGVRVRAVVSDRELRELRHDGVKLNASGAFRDEEA